MLNASRKASHTPFAPPVHTFAARQLGGTEPPELDHFGVRTADLRAFSWGRNLICGFLFLSAWTTWKNENIKWMRRVSQNHFAETNEKGARCFGLGDCHGFLCHVEAVIRSRHVGRWCLRGTVAFPRDTSCALMKLMKLMTVGCAFTRYLPIFNHFRSFSRVRSQLNSYACRYVANVRSVPMLMTQCRSFFA